MREKNEVMMLKEDAKLILMERELEIIRFEKEMAKEERM